MNQALYRKYRSKSFEDVVGQDHITKTLKNAVKSGRISHAYLFTGPRGVGKTSVARILAHAANGLEYENESTHLDIIEIDAASNRRIDEIRDLREKVGIAPAAGKYKVYIIDEVHMLTREAFNALLKTLEEPPKHCIFILATTESHKLPDTIISRTQRFEFKPISIEQAVAHLESIAKSEKITIEPAALELLAEFGNGSFRDSISLLDQLSSGSNNITAKDVRNMLGVPSATDIQAIVKAVSGGDIKNLLEAIQSLKNKGIDAALAAKAISAEVKAEIVEGSVSDIALLKGLIEVPSSSKPYEYLEIILLEACGTSSRQPDKTKEHIVPVAKAKPPKEAATAKSVYKEEPEAVIPATNEVALDTHIWEKVISLSKAKAASLYTALRLAEPLFETGSLVLRFQFPLHQKKVEQPKNMVMLAEIIKELTGSVPDIRCEVDKTAFKKNVIKLEPVANEANPLHSISSVFGGAEVIE